MTYRGSYLSNLNIWAALLNLLLKTEDAFKHSAKLEL